MERAGRERGSPEQVEHRAVEQVGEQLSQRLTSRGRSSTPRSSSACSARPRRKRERCCERRIGESCLPVRKTLANCDWAFQPKLDRAAVEVLAGLGFIDRQQDLVITGKPGTGKSHILMLIALRACEAGHLVRYARFVDLLIELHAGLADGSYERRLRRWARFPLVVLDDVGLGQVPAHGDAPTAAHMLWNLIDLRHQRSTTTISSNVKLS